MSSPQLHILLPAAGAGKRYGADTPKQYQPFGNAGSLLDHTIGQLLEVPHEGSLVVAIDEFDPYWVDSRYAEDSRVRTVAGGDQRAKTVWNALGCLDCKDDDWVLVHDAVRPCISRTMLLPLLERLQTTHCAGVSLGRPVYEAVKRVDENGIVQKSEERKRLWTTQTPQVFRYAALFCALHDAIKSQLHLDDEMMALQSAGFETEMLSGSIVNIKVTQPGDMQLAEQLFSLVD